MPQRISDLFDIDATLLRQNNVFNGFIEIDSKLHIDPRLLSKSSAPEFKESYGKFIRYFDSVLDKISEFIELSSKKAPKYSSDFDQQISQQIVMHQIVEDLTFSEIPLSGLGYSVNHTKGKGIGNKLATDLAKTAIALVEAGIRDPVVFELAGLFELGIGSDRISDMIIRILLHDIARFSERIARSLNLPRANKPVADYFFGNELPCYKDQAILLLPEDILSDLQVADSWTNADSITIHNQDVRNYLNKKIGQSWRESYTWKDLLKNKTSKKKIKEMIQDCPELVRDLLEQYKHKSAVPYDFQLDPEGVFSWHDNARDYVNKFPLDLQDFENAKDLDLVDILIKQFSKLVRDGLCIDLHKESGDPKQEEVGQLILWELFEKYTQNTCIDIEHNSKHRTTILHKRQFGKTTKVCEIVLKFTSTRKVVDDYEKLLETVNSGLITHYTAFVLVQVSTSARQMVVDGINRLDRKSVV